MAGWLRTVAVLVPPDERADWIEEWEGELAAHGWRWRDASGAFSDAWFLGREEWRMGRVFQDTRHAMKSLARRPHFTALAGLTLAVGIAANTAIFSVIDSVLLNPLPYPDSDRLVSVVHTAPGLNLPVIPQSEASYAFYAERARTLESLAVYQRDDVNLMLEGDPRRASSARVTHRFFEVLGVPAAHGRAFSEGDDLAGAEPVAVLGHALWVEAFGGDPGVVDRVVEMDGIARRVVGVMPRGFSFPDDAELWTPVALDPTAMDAGSFSLIGVGRLAQGATVEGLNVELDGLLLAYSDLRPAELPRSVLEQARMRSDARPLKDAAVGDMARALWVILGTVGFVLLITCANVANLFLVRAEARQREHALRTALGASRGDLMRFSMIESLVLACGAGGVGLALAKVGVPMLMGLAPAGMPRAEEVGIDGSVLVFTLAVSLAAGVLFGLFPLLGLARRGKDLSGGLREGGRSSTVGPRRHRVRGALVVAQMGLALVLLIGSVLMARSFAAMRAVDPGFDPDGRLAFRMALPSATYPDAGSAEAVYRALRERLEGLPGVRSASLAFAMPLSGAKNASSLEPEDRPFGEGELGPIVDRQAVAPGYFEAMGIAIVEGRGIGEDDAAHRIRGVVVSESLARRFWPEAPSVLGRRIRFQQADEAPWEVVGVAADIRFETLSEVTESMVYFPLVGGSVETPVPTRSLWAVLAVDDDPLGYVAAARGVLREVDPRMPMVDPRTVDSLVRDASAQTSFTMVLLAIAAAIALMLGSVGLYGVLSYVVSQRTQEIGVRMALGAPAQQVVRKMVAEGMALAGAGILLGGLGAWAASRMLASLLYGVSATDPLTYGGTALLLSVVALLASWLPARRASRVDPVTALRAE